MYIVIILVIAVDSVTILNKEMYLGTLNSINNTNTKLETISQDIIDNTNVSKIYTEITNKDIPVDINSTSGFKIFINNNIKIDIQSTLNNDSRTFYIRTVPTDFPEYKLVGQSQYESDYYLNASTKSILYHENN